MLYGRYPSLDQVIEALGGLVLYEEYRGDFALARQVAEYQIAAARARAEQNSLASARLGRGIVQWLQGEAAAQDCFEEIEQEAATPELALLAFAYGVLARQRRYLLFPGEAASTTLEIQTRWNQMGEGIEYDRRWGELAGSGVTSDGVTPDGITSDTIFDARIHAAYLYRVLHNVPIGRYILTGSRDLSMAAERERQFSVVTGPLLQFRGQVADGPPGLRASLDRLLADLCWHGRALDDAQQLLLRAQETYAAAGDDAGAAACWMTYGDWMCAPFSSPLVYNHLMQEGDWNNTLSWVRERAEFERSSLNPAAATTAYAEAERLYTAAGALRGVAAVALRRAYLQMLAGDPVQASTEAANAVALFTRTGDTLGVWLAQTHQLLIAVAVPGRNADSAIAAAIGEWGKTEGSFSYATGLGILLTRAGRRWLMVEGDHERAMACYRLAQTLFQALGAPDNAAQSLADQGVAYSLVGDSTAALVAFEAARDRFASQIVEKPALATAAWQKALLAADEVCQLYQVRQDADGLALSTDRLAGLYAQPARGGPDLFGEAFPNTLQDQITLRSELAGVQVPIFRALAAREAGNPQEEARQLQMALAAAGESSPGHSDFLVANVLYIWRRNAEAEAALDAYLEAGGATAGFVGALTEQMAERFGPAGAAIAENRAEVTHRLAARFFANVKAFARARTHLNALASIAGEEWWQHDEQPWEAHQLMGEVAEGLGELAEARAAYARGMAMVEARRQLQTRDEIRVALAGQGGVHSLYFYAARATLRAWIEAGQEDDRTNSGQLAAQLSSQLVEIAERGKARALLDLLAVGSDTGNDGDSAYRQMRRLGAQSTLWRSLLQQERRARHFDAERIKQLEENIAQNEAALRQLEATLPTGPASLVQPQVIALTELQQRLPPQTALLYYYFQNEELLAWAITSQGIVAAHLVELEARRLNREIRQFHDACARPRSGQADAIGETLSRRLLAPFARVLEQHPKLLVVPHGAAHLVPFHALSWQGAPLGMTHTLSYLPNASVLQFLTPGKPLRGRRILAVGNPARMRFAPPLGGDAVALAPLPAAEAEAHVVAALFPERVVLTSAAATLEAVNRALPGVPVIHLATHGYLSEEAPLLSAVLLAEGSALRVDEIMGLHLNAELVVLSACETGRGETTGGDDVVGLTRALLAAGAKSVVVTLWPVNDASTSLLMGEFYRQLRAGTSPAAALRAAQEYLRNLTPAAIDAELLELAAALRSGGSTADVASSLTAGRHLQPVAGSPQASRDYRHPHHWAPFILIG